MLSTISLGPANYPPEIIGFAESWIASPGEMVDLKISSTESIYTYQYRTTHPGLQES